MNKELRAEIVKEIVAEVMGNIKPIILMAEKENGSHYTVYDELTKATKDSSKLGEIAEVQFKGVGIQYEGISIDDNGLGDSVITLYRNGVHEFIEVARIVLEGDKEYRVSNPSTYYPELIEL